MGELTIHNPPQFELALWAQIVKRNFIVIKVGFV
jgi:hypothetical protein